MIDARRVAGSVTLMLPRSTTTAMRLDQVHIRILQILEQDGRATVSSIAREVGLTDNAVRYRIRKLRASGIVRRVTVHVDPSRLGHDASAIVLLRLGSGADLAGLRGQRQVAMLCETQGAFQAVALVVERDRQALERFLAELRRAPAVAEAVVLNVAADADLPVVPSVCTNGSRAERPPAN